jgi:hypothetical protein
MAGGWKMTAISVDLEMVEGTMTGMTTKGQPS